MSRRVVLPTELQIGEALEALRREQPAKPPTVVAVAEHLGLSNATFWRYFPDLCQGIADTRRRALRTPPAADQETNDADHRTILARLRRDNARLESELKRAAAEVQRLTLENGVLIAHAQQASKVIPLKPRA
ncbi:hypothetical protein [Microbacterium murale]|uniref:Transposase n=1 Tax=Microbacterium murale TaxID=1081040 RepID=A0ABQ1RQW7_9MICO|nr:hypothetical protein [Microbacterium murale]GGD76392.1 hypothetical protein GCM10007269_19280 [Microbacterium murale]